MSLEETSEPQKRTATLTDALISVLWDPEQRTQLTYTCTPNPQKLWHSEFILLFVTKVVVILNTAIEK